LEEGGLPQVAGLQAAQTAGAVVLQLGPILPHQSALLGHQKRKPWTKGSSWRQSGKAFSFPTHSRRSWLIGWLKKPLASGVKHSSTSSRRSSRTCRLSQNQPTFGRADPRKPGHPANPDRKAHLLCARSGRRK